MYIDTVGQDRELQDELNTEENDHDPGIKSVSAFKVQRDIYLNEVELYRVDWRHCCTVHET